MKKQLYEQPLAEVFEVRLQANVLQTASPNSERPDSASSGYDNENDLGEI